MTWSWLVVLLPKHLQCDGGGWCCDCRCGDGRGDRHCSSEEIERWNLGAGKGTKKDHCHQNESSVGCQQHGAPLALLDADDQSELQCSRVDPHQCPGKLKEWNGE